MRNRLAIAGLCVALILAALIPNAGAVKISQPGASVNLAAPGPIGGTTSSTGQFTALCVGTSPCTLPTAGQLTAADNGSDHIAGLRGQIGTGAELTDNGSAIVVGTSSLFATQTPFRITSSDNAVSSMARVALTFPIAAVAATTTTQWGETKIVKAITVENVVFNIGAFTCSVNPAFSLLDCSNAAGTCTPVATLATSGTLTGIGSTNAATTPTANVAAGEYIAVEFTAGTCPVLNGTVAVMARPQ